MRTLVRRAGIALAIGAAWLAASCGLGATVPRLSLGVSAVRAPAAAAGWDTRFEAFLSMEARAAEAPPAGSGESLASTERAAPLPCRDAGACAWERLSVSRALARWNGGTR